MASMPENLSSEFAKNKDQCHVTRSIQNFILYLVSVAEQAGLSLTWSETLKTSFQVWRPKWKYQTPFGIYICVTEITIQKYNNL